MLPITDSNEARHFARQECSHFYAYTWKLCDCLQTHTQSMVWLQFSVENGWKIPPIAHIKYIFRRWWRQQKPHISHSFFCHILLSLFKFIVFTSIKLKCLLINISANKHNITRADWVRMTIYTIYIIHIFCFFFELHLWLWFVQHAFYVDVCVFKIAT